MLGNKGAIIRYALKYARKIERHNDFYLVVFGEYGSPDYALFRFPKGTSCWYWAEKEEGRRNERG